MNRISKTLFGGALISAGLVTNAMAGNTHPLPRAHSNGHHVGGGPGKDYGVLYDQSGYNPGYSAFVDQVFSDFPGNPGPYDAFLVDDFSTGGQTWNITSVHTFYVDYGYDWAGYTKGKLQFYPKSGSLPSDGADIAPEYDVTISITHGGGPGGGTLEVSATGLNIPELLGVNGDYWVGLTPIADFGSHFETFHFVNSVQAGDASAFRNPGGGFGVGTGWINSGNLTDGGKYDMAYYLDGDVVPAPGAAALLGIGGLVAGRRRRN